MTLEVRISLLGGIISLIVLRLEEGGVSMVKSMISVVLETRISLLGWVIPFMVLRLEGGGVSMVKSMISTILLSDFAEAENWALFWC